MRFVCVLRVSALFFRDMFSLESTVSSLRRLTRMRSGARRAITAELVSRLNTRCSAQVTLVTGVLIVTEYSTVWLGTRNTSKGT